MIGLSSTAERVAAVYGALFFAFGIYLPFYPLLLADRGMGDTEIAVLIAVPMALRAALASPLGIIADRIGDRRRVLMLYSIVAALTFTAFAFANGFIALLVISVVTSLFSNASTPVTDALATSVVRAGAGDYGRMRMWGSISFVVANMLGGLMISELSAHALYWVLLVSFWAAAAILTIVPPRMAAAAEPSALRETIASVESRTIRPHFLKDGVLMGGLVAAALIQASHAMLYSFSSLYWNSIGFGGVTVGLFWAMGVLSEILMFFLSTRLLGAWGPGQMLVLSGAATTARWLLFPLMTSVPGYLALQSLHALTFACAHLAMMRLIVTRVPDRSAATVQGLYATVGSLTMAAATLAAGPLYRNYGGQGFQIMSLIAIVGVGLALMWVPLRRQATFDLA